MNIYKITEENKKKEEEIKRQILNNDEYPPQIKKKTKQKSSTIEPHTTQIKVSLLHILAYMLEHLPVAAP
jgi:hypothetical protein